MEIRDDRRTSRNANSKVNLVDGIQVEHHAMTKTRNVIIRRRQLRMDWHELRQPQRGVLDECFGNK